ncbi:MAG: hypothetical protein ACU85V_19180, partial [Gammaproteobacteria bacterium]
MKRTTLSIAIAAACSGGAHAVDQSTVDTNIVIGGATAIQTSTQNAIIDDICTGSIDVYQGEDHWNVACTVGGDDILFQKNNGGSGQGVTSVDLDTGVEVLDPSSTCVGASASATPAGTAYTFNDCDPDSAGVTEVLAQEVPDWGVSDVEPKMFRGALSILVNDVATPLPNNSTIESFPTASLPFGMVATLSLYQALQAVQFPDDSKCNPDATLGGSDDGSLPGSSAGNGIRDEYETYGTDGAQYVNFDGSGNHIPEAADSKGYSDQPHRVGDTRECMPTISKTEAVSMLRGDFGSWDQFVTADGTGLFSGALGKPWAAIAPNFNLCRRIQGSGTHAVIASQILRTECGAGASLMAEPDPTPGLPAVPPRLVWGNQGSSNLGECLDDLETGAANEVGGITGGAAPLWAVGYQSVEKNPDLEEAYRFMKIDGQSPDMKNFVEGDYWIFGSTTVNRDGPGQYVNPDPAVLTGAEVDALFDQLVTSLSDPSLLLGL